MFPSENVCKDTAFLEYAKQNGHFFEKYFSKPRPDADGALKNAAALNPEDGGTFRENGRTQNTFPPKSLSVPQKVASFADATIERIMADNYIEKQYEAYEARKAAWEKASKYKRKKPAAETAGRPCERLFHNHSKKVVAIHDLSGAGRVSLMAVIPILSTMGLQVCPLPTAILSTHTQYPAYSFLDLTDEMKRIIDKWEQLDIRFDAFYSGYLGSPRQAQIVESFIRKFRRPADLVVVDPVMGDNGSLYKGITEDMVTEMKQLICLADIITPNMTELFRLLDMPYQENMSDAELKAVLKALSDKGPSIVIVTSVPVKDDPHSTSVYAYNRFGNRYWKVTCPYLPAHYPGTGDTFTSVITGSLMQGDSLPIALDRATQFILQGIRATFGYEYNNLEGIMLEKVLPNLNMPIQVSSYELLE